MKIVKIDFGVPKVGSGMTQSFGSDYYAFEVTSVSDDKKRVIVRSCKPNVISGSVCDGTAVYDLTELYGRPTELRFRYGAWYNIFSDGRLPEKIKNMKFGVKIQYQDPSF